MFGELVDVVLFFGEQVQYLEETSVRAESSFQGKGGTQTNAASPKWNGVRRSGHAFA